MSSRNVCLEALGGLVNGSTLPLLTLDRERRLTFANPAAQEFLDLSSDNLGQVYNWSEVGENEDLTHIHQRVLGGERLSGQSFVRHTREGRRLDLRAWVSPSRDVNGVINGSVVVLMDDGENRRREKRNRLLYNISRLLEDATDVRRTMPAVLAAIASELGWDSGSFWEHCPAGFAKRSAEWHAAGSFDPPCIVASDKRYTTTVMARACSDRAPAAIADYPAVALCKSCPHHPCGGAPSQVLCVPIVLSNRTLAAMTFHVSASDRFDDADSLTCMKTIAGQIAQWIDRARAQANLAESERRLRAIVEHAGLGIVVGNDEGRLTHCNRALADMLGYTPDELQGKNFRELTHPDDLVDEVNLFSELLDATRDTYTTEKRLVCKDGKETWVRVTVTACSKEPVLLIGIAENIDTQRRLLQELQESESRYRLMVEGSEQLFFYQQDAQHRFRYLSPSVRNVIGYDVSELLNRQFDSILSADSSAAQAIQITDSAMSDGQRRAPYNVSVRHRKGQIVVLEVIETPLRHSSGEIIMHGMARDVTPLKEAEHRLRVSDDILSALETMVVVANSRGEIVYVNPYTTKLLGFSAHELLGLGWWTNTFPNVDQGRATMERVAACARGERALIKGEPQLMTASDGSQRWILWRDTLTDGNLIIGAGQDITQRKLAEEALSYRTTYLNELIENSPLGIVAIDCDGFVEMCNPAFERLFQYSKAELQGRQLTDVITRAETRAESESFILRAAHGEPSHAITQRTCKDGTSRIIELHSIPLRVESRVIGAYGVYRDITDKVQAEKNLRESERLLDLFFRQSVAGAFFMMLDAPVRWDGTDETFEYLWKHTRCTKVNQAMLRQYAMPEEATLELSPQDVNKRTPSLSRDSWRKLLDDGSLEIEFEDHRSDGDMILVEGHYSCIYDGDGRLTGFFGMQRDVTSRRLAEQALAASEQQLRAIFTSSMDGMLIFNDSGIYLDANPAACELIGVAKEHIVGKRVGTFMPSESGGTWLVGELKEKGTLFGPNEVMRPDGSILSVEFAATANILPGLHVSILRDTTLRRKLEHQLQQSQKMEAIGNLAGGVAHDFNNMLTAIRGYSELLLKKLPESNPLRRYASGILNAADRAALTTQQLLAFSRRQVVQVRSVDINHVIRDMDGLIRRLIGEDIEIHTCLADGLGLVIADSGQIGQVVLNLAVNARDAMPGGGRLTIQTQNVELDATYAASHLSSRAGSYVMLAVTDTGCGIDPAVKPHIFEPFFTTKAPGKGTGLGLATIYGIVHQGRGSIYVYSEPGEGTTFKIYLPRTSAQEIGDTDVIPSTRTTSASAHTIDQRRATVCVIEDEESPRNLITECLTTAGHHVVSASTGAEAMNLLNEADLNIDLLLTDVMLSGVNGHDLAGFVAMKHPNAVIVYMSGFTKDVLVERGVLEPSSHFIGKPFAVSQLMRFIESTLHSRPSQVQPPQTLAIRRNREI